MNFDDLYEILIFLFVIGAFIFEALGKGKKKKLPQGPSRRPAPQGQTRQAPRPKPQVRQKRVTWDEAYRGTTAPEPKSQPAAPPDVQVYKVEDQAFEVPTEVSVEAQPNFGSSAPLEQKLEKLEEQESLGHLLQSDPIKVAVKYRGEILPSLSKKKQLRKTFLMMELLQPPKSLREESY